MSRTAAGRIESFQRSTAWRAAFALVLAGGMAAATFPQYAYGVLAPFLLDEFGISRSRLGLLTTAGFLVGMVLSPPAGRLVDALGGRRVFVGASALTGLTAVLMAFSPSFNWMLVGAAVVGIGFACCNPTTNKLIAAHTNRGEQGLITGIKQSGVQFAAFLTGVSLPVLAGAVGWRPALALAALLPALVLVSCLVVVPADPRIEARAGIRRDPLDPAVWWLTAYGFLMGAGVSVVGAYLPLFAQENVGLSVNTAGFVAALLGLVGIVSRVAWGWGVERTERFSSALVVLGAGAVVATLLVASASTFGPALLWLGVVLLGATAIPWNAIGMLTLIAEAGGEQAGRAAGYVLAGFYGGFVVTPPLFGYSVDVTGGYGLGWTSIAALFGAATLLAAAWHRTRRPA